MSARTVVLDFWASYNTGNIEEAWSQFIADHVVLHPPADVELTRESWKVFEHGFVAAFDCMNVKVNDQVSEGNKVATRWTLTAVDQKAEFMGIGPSGRTATPVRSLSMSFTGARSSITGQKSALRHVSANSPITKTPLILAALFIPFPSGAVLVRQRVRAAPWGTETAAKRRRWSHCSHSTRCRGDEHA